MASFDASEAQTEQVGRVASLENTMGGVMAELHRLNHWWPNKLNMLKMLIIIRMMVYNMFPPSSYP